MIKRIPVIVISGFLGSGKTTFLRYLLKESNKKFGLIINEFGMLELMVTWLKVVMAAMIQMKIVLLN